jgi:hypothetical protein
MQRSEANGETKTIALGFEWTPGQQAAIFAWQERRLLVRSLAFATAAERGLESHLSTAQQQIAELDTPRQRPADAHRDRDGPGSGGCHSDPQSGERAAGAQL